MTIDRRSFAALPFLAAAGPAAAKAVPPGARVERAARGAMEGKVTGSVLAARAGKVIWAGGIGDPEGKLPTPRRTTMFDALSIGKTFTALAIMRMADAGKVDLNKPVKLYLPELPEALADIKVRHALNNDTGLPVYLEGEDTTPKTRDQAMAEILAIKPERKAGTGQRYSNVNFHLLGLMLERVAGAGYHEAIRTLVLEPAGLTSTLFFSDPRLKAMDVATGYVDGKPMGSPVAWPDTWNMLGAAGLATTVDDLYRLNRAFLAGHVLSPLGRARLLLAGAPTYGRGPYVGPDNIDISYGAGLYHWLDRQGRHVHFHGGDGDFGFNATMLWRQEDDVFVCVLMNSRREDRLLDRGELMAALLAAV